MSLTVEQVIEEAVADPLSAYHSHAIKALLTYERGKPEELIVAKHYIEKMLRLDGASNVSNISSSGISP